MEKITSINPERLKWSLQDRGVKVQQLAASTHISEQTLAQILEREGSLTFGQLQRLAQYFNRGVLFFIEPGVPSEAQYYSTQFRTLANQKPQITPKVRGLIERVEHQRRVFMDLLEELGEDPAAEFNPPNVPGNSPAAASRIVRQWLGLTDQGDFESYRMAIEAKGVLVFRTNGYNGPWQIPKTDPVEGFCLYYSTFPVIVVKKHEAPARQVFTLFHELAHLVLHRESSIDDETDFANQAAREREANSFAGNLLVPDEMLDRIESAAKPDTPVGYDHWLRGIRNSLSVSTAVILRRLLDAGKLTSDEYNAYRMWNEAQTANASDTGTRQYRHREPLHVFGPRFTRTVLEALNRQQISTVKASKYLDNLKLDDLRKLEAYVASS